MAKRERARRSGLALGLAGLRPGGKLPVACVVGRDPAFWAGSGLAFQDGVEFSGVAEVAADGALLVRGSWSAQASYECARCLEPLEVPIRRSVVLFYGLDDEAAGDDPDARTIDARTAEADLGEAIREEALLETPRSYMPEADDDGRCAKCGVSAAGLAQTPEDRKRPDPRWAKLEALKTKH